MRGFDFGQIGEVLSEVMDTDYIDVKRDVKGSLTEMYSNVPCHMAYVSIDNPDPLSVDVKPVVQAIRVHLPLWVDVRNDDFLIAKKMDSYGNVAWTYSGRCGNPVVSQGRKKVLMQMNSTEPENPTPTPPTDVHTVYVSYTSSDVEIAPSRKVVVNDGADVTLEPSALDGYTISHALVDGTSVEGGSVTLQYVREDHDVVFVYLASDVPETYRYLVKGLYTKDDGTLANGWHTYRRMPIDSCTKDGDVYTIECEDVKLEHRDNGKVLSIQTGALLVLSGDVFVRVTDVDRMDGRVVFNAVVFQPTAEQESCYRTRWYDA